MSSNIFTYGSLMFAEVWKPLVFLGKQSQLLKGVAYGPQATDFRIEMSAEPTIDGGWGLGEVD